MIKILTTLLSSIIASVAIASESENFFVRISADKGEITAHANGSFSITPTTTSTTNAITVTITPKLDWQLIAPRSGKMTVSPSKTGAYRLLSVLGEDSPTGEVHVCSYPVTTITNHLSSPRTCIDFEVAGSPFIYASSNTGCDIAVGGNANETATGLHEIVTTYAPCPKCESAPATPEEHSTFETSFDRYSWRITTGNKAISAYGTHISKTLPNVSKGAHRVSATCNATYSQCSLCADSKTQITNAIVSELTIECPPWLGLDRTDAATITTNAAIAHLTPEQDNLSCSWINGSICQIAPSDDTFRCDIWQPNNETESTDYLAEAITARIGRASISTNFTVVKVDIEIEDTSEIEEERQGCYSFPGNIKNITLRYFPSDIAGFITFECNSSENGIRIWKDIYKTEQLQLPSVFVVDETPMYLYAELVSSNSVQSEISLRHNSKAIDKAKVNICENPNIVLYPAWRGEINESVLEKDEYDPGALVTVHSTDHLSAKIKFTGFTLLPPGHKRYYRVSKPGFICFDGMPISDEEVEITGLNDKIVVTEMTSPEAWGEESHVTIQYYIKDGRSNIIKQDECTLLRPYVVAIGDSLTYGLMRNSRRQFLTPRWNYPWGNYPTANDWNDPHLINPSETNRFLKSYQGYRGYLAEKLPGFTWLGRNTNGHGPKHNGLPGATIEQAGPLLNFNTSFFDKIPSYTIVIYWTGMNNCTHGSITNNYSIINNWYSNVNAILSNRINKGRTICATLQLPSFSDNYANIESPSGYDKHNNIKFFNSIISKYTVSTNHFKGISIPLNIIHDSDDDGLHFFPSGYKSISDSIFNALCEEIKNVNY